MAFSRKNRIQIALSIYQSIDQNRMFIKKHHCLPQGKSAIFHSFHTIISRHYFSTRLLLSMNTLIDALAVQYPQRNLNRRFEAICCANISSVASRQTSSLESMFYSHINGKSRFGEKIQFDSMQYLYLHQSVCRLTHSDGNFPLVLLTALCKQSQTADGFFFQFSLLNRFSFAFEGKVFFFPLAYAMRG